MRKQIDTYSTPELLKSLISNASSCNTINSKASNLPLKYLYRRALKKQESKENFNKCFNQSNSQPILMTGGYSTSSNTVINQPSMHRQSLSALPNDKSKLLKLVKEQLGNNYLLIDLNTIIAEDQTSSDGTLDIFNQAKLILKSKLTSNKKMAFIQGYQEDQFVKIINELIQEVVQSYSQKIQILEQQLQNYRLEAENAKLITSYDQISQRININKSTSNESPNDLKTIQMSEIKNDPLLKNTEGTFSMRSLMSMSSLAEEINIGNNIQDRIKKFNFQTVFDYLPSKNITEFKMLTQEEKEKYIIDRNRQALETRMQQLMNITVNVEDDSMDEQLLPHAHPPNNFYKNILEQQMKGVDSMATLKDHINEYPQFQRLSEVKDLKSQIKYEENFRTFSRNQQDHGYSSDEQEEWIMQVKSCGLNQTRDSDLSSLCEEGIRINQECKSELKKVKHKGELKQAIDDNINNIIYR